MKKSIIIHGVYIVICIMLLTFGLIQKTIVKQQWELANRNAIEARQNADEAMRQNAIAEKNAEMAMRQQEIAEELRAKLDECQKRYK